MGFIGNGLLTVLMANATDNLSVGEKLEQGLLNTVIGMGTVFVVLIFISLLISCFRVIPYLQQKFTKKPEAAEKIEEAAVPVSEPEEELTDDTELAAVITAAIMASMGDEAPEDGLVVRSIKRVNKKKWQNA